MKEWNEGPTAMHQEGPGTLLSMSTVFSPSQSSDLPCHPGVQLARLRLRGSLRGVPVLQVSEPGSWGSGGLCVVERGRYHVPLLRCPGTEGQAGGWVGSRGHQSTWIPQRDAGVGFPMDPAKQASRKPGLEWCGATLVPGGELRLQCQRAAHVTLCPWLSPTAPPPPPELPGARDEAPDAARVLWGEHRGEPRAHARDPVSGAAGPGGAGRPGGGAQQAPLPLGSPSACCSPRRHGHDLKRLCPQVAFPATSPARPEPTCDHFHTDLHPQPGWFLF